MFCEMCGKFTTVQKFIPPRSKAITRLICVCPKCFNQLGEQITSIKIVSEIFEKISSKMEDVKLFLSNNSLEFVKGYFTGKLANYLLHNLPVIDDKTKSNIISLLYPNNILPRFS